MFNCWYRCDCSGVGRGAARGVAAVAADVRAGPGEAGVRRAEGGRPLRAHADPAARGLLRGAGWPPWFAPANATLNSHIPLH